MRTPRLVNTIIYFVKLTLYSFEQRREATFGGRLAADQRVDGHFETPCRAGLGLARFTHTYERALVVHRARNITAPSLAPQAMVAAFKLVNR